MHKKTSQASLVRGQKLVNNTYGIRFALRLLFLLFIAGQYGVGSGICSINKYRGIYRLIQILKRRIDKMSWEFSFLRRGLWSFWRLCTESRWTVLGLLSGLDSALYARVMAFELYVAVCVLNFWFNRAFKRFFFVFFFRTTHIFRVFFCQIQVIDIFNCL